MHIVKRQSGFTGALCMPNNAFFYTTINRALDGLGGK